MNYNNLNYNYFERLNKTNSGGGNFQIPYSLGQLSSNNSTTQKRNRVLKEDDFIPDKSIHRYISRLSENEIVKKLTEKNIPTDTPFKGELQRRLFNSMISEKYQQKSRVSTSKATEFQNFYPQSSQFPFPLRNFGNTNFMNFSNPILLDQKQRVANLNKRKGKNIPSSSIIKPKIMKTFITQPKKKLTIEEELNFVKKEPCGEQNNLNCIKLIEGLVGNGYDDRYIGGKGNIKTPIPKQVVELKPGHVQLKGVPPTQLILNCTLLAYNSNINKQKIIEKIASTFFKKERDKWIAEFDSLILKYSSHSDGPQFILRFSLFKRGLEQEINRLFAIDSHPFKTITKKGIKKRGGSGA